MAECKIIALPAFERQFHRLLKRYPSLSTDLVKLNVLLKKNPTIGTPIGGNAYKIRLSIKSKGKGKRGGGRVITFYLKTDQELFLLSIYDKSEQSDIPEKTVRAMIEEAIRVNLSDTI